MLGIATISLTTPQNTTAFIWRKNTKSSYKSVILSYMWGHILVDDDKNWSTRLFFRKRKVIIISNQWLSPSSIYITSRCLKRSILRTVFWSFKLFTWEDWGIMQNQGLWSGCGSWLWRWCYAGRFATTISSATQLFNVGTLLQPFETMLQQCCNAVLRQKSALRIVPCNITLRMM